MRLLGVDFGFKRIGIAVVDSDAGIPSPRPALDASGKLKTDAETLKRLAAREEAQGIVLGLPIEPAGEEGRMARVCRQLAGHIEAQGLSVFLVDERLTSVEAERNLLQEDLTGAMRRKRRDAEAACLILERYLDGEKAS